ncbi:MAG: ATP synthase F1 subunit delta [Candidatus Kapaibacterium sp.]
MKHVRVAKRYALALFASSKAEGSLERVREDAEMILHGIRSAHDFKAVLRSPIIQSWKKKNLMNEIFEGRITTITQAFLGILCAHGRENITEDILEQFFVYYNEEMRRVPITVTSAVALDSGSMAAIEDGISKKYAKTPIAEYHVDASLKGGLRVQIGDVLLDSSLRTQLERLRDSLLANGTIGS